MKKILCPNCGVENKTKSDPRDFYIPLSSDYIKCWSCKRVMIAVTKFGKLVRILK